MSPKKKTETDAPSDTLSWLSHPTRLFKQPNKHKENYKCVISIDGLKHNEYSNKKSSQTSTGQLDIEDVVTNNGYHMFKGGKHVKKGGVKSNNGNGSNMGETREIVTPESNGSSNESNRDQNENAKDSKTKNYEKMKCLDFIQYVAIKFKNEDDAFCNTIMKILDIDKMQGSKVKAIKYDLVNILLSLLLDSTEDDMKLIEDTLKAMVIPDSVKRFVVDNSFIRQTEFCLGEGSMSVVCSGVFYKDGLCTKVALKKSKKPISNLFDKMIISEATILSQLDHKNIIKMLAFKKDGPEIVLEFMGLGCLNQALMRVTFFDKELLTALSDIAKGMEFLHGEQYLHRDLACRNVFVNLRKECKIGDFGLSVYVGDSNGVFRDTESGLKNDSPETYASGIFRFQTDVWAMGLLILEMYHFASSKVADPFFLPFLTALGPLIREGVGLTKPKRCPYDLFQFTKNHLLNTNFENRPDFSVIRKTMESYLTK